MSTWTDRELKTIDHADEVSSPADQDAISHAYQAKYGRYAKSIVDSVLTPGALAATIKATPR